MNYNATIDGNENEKEYYEESERAPYLEGYWNDTQGTGDPSLTNLNSRQLSRTSHLTASNSSALLSSDGEEADAAAGGTTNSVLKRVSSFSLSMSRSPPGTSNNQNQNQNAPPSSVYHGSNLHQMRGSNNIMGSPTGSVPVFPMSSSTGALHDAPNFHSLSSLHARGGPGGVYGAMDGQTTINEGVKPSWRLRDRMKTVGVGLVMALNVGTDPPDIIKPHPCAKLQCWMDPSSVTRAKAKEKIGERLEAQYAKWQQQKAARPLKYRRALDPTVEDVRALCLWLRRQSRQERILLHYNGHGVPRPTANGEIWVFDKNHTEYIPLSVRDLRQWMGKPSIVVLDCSMAGILIPFLTCPLTESPPNTPPRPQQQGQGPHDQDEQNEQGPEETDMETAASHWVKDTIVLCPTSASDQEWLPMHPDYPADIFTSCLTTPIKIALRWFVRRNRQSMGGLNPEAVDAIPGKSNDRKTPLGELNWIFTAVTDSIAWNVLPKPLFQRLFRQDLLVASMFRNFLLADRILRSLNCTPQSYPPLPPGVADHPLWQAWDLACETCLFGLLKDGILGNHVVKPPVVVTPGSTGPPSGSTSLDGTEVAPIPAMTGRDMTTGHKPGPTPVKSALSPPPMATTGMASSISSPFFSEQLTAFEIWLEYASIHKAKLEDAEYASSNQPPLESPEQLPVVLQVLLSQVHRVRALLLLRRFLDLGPWAVNLSLSLGIFPYVMKLLQSPEYKSLLVGIWASILKFDPSCQVDLVKDGALPHFIQPLTTWGAPSGHPHVVRDSAKQRTLAAFSLAATCFNYPAAQTECLRQNLHGHCCALLTTFVKMGEHHRQQQRMHQQQLQQQQPHRRHQHHDQPSHSLPEDDEMLPHSQHLPSDARLWLCICLGNLFKNNPPAQNEGFNSNVHLCLFSCLQDSAPVVRASVCYALGCLLDSTAWKPQGNGGAGGPNVMVPPQPPPPAMGTSIYNPNSPGSGAPFPGGPQVLVPQHMSAATMTVPAALTASAILSGHLQPTIPNQGNNPPNMWGPQQQQQQQHQMPQGHPGYPLQQPPGPHQQLPHQQQNPMNRMGPPALPQPGLRMAPPPGQQVPGGHPIMHQQHLLRPRGQGMPSHNGPNPVMNVMGPPHARMDNPNLMGSPHHPHGHPHAHHPHQHPHHPHGGPAPLIMNPMTPPPMERRRPPTPFDDRRRVELDFIVAEMLLRVLDDGSSVVRYEAVISLCRFVGKYLQAYLVVAEELSTPAPSKDSKEEQKDTAEGKATPLHQQDDKKNLVPIPRGVSRVMLDRFATTWKAIRSVQHTDTHKKIAGAANTLVSYVHEELLDLRTEMTLRNAAQNNESAQSDGLLLGIQEEGGRGLAAEADQELLFQQQQSHPRSDGPLHRLPANKLSQFRRTASDIGNAVMWQSEVPDPLGSPILSGRGGGGPTHIPDPSKKKEFHLPTSSFYDWKKTTFKSTYDDSEEEDLLERDPLSPSGAARSYQRRRNARARGMGRKLANRFSGLAPKPPKKREGWDVLLEDDDDADDKDSSLKGDLKLRETKILPNSGVKMTSMLKFHAYEDALVVCDNEDGISIWDYEKGARSSVFRNGNPKGSRMTSAFWINEKSSSLFCVGCDDGSARVWDGTVECNGEISRHRPTLAAAFSAVPGMTAGQRGSGLICEWQQFSGKLVAGGNSDCIRIWDLGSEQCGTKLETNTEACVTTLTTAWEEDQGGFVQGSHQGMGPEIVVAGHSDGSLRVFDIRSPQMAAVAPTTTTTSVSRRSRRPTIFTEHGSYIVDTSFTNYGGRNTIISGSVAGDIRAWDLRVSSSLRTLDVQRSPMTALSVHKQIPIAATGSHAQFIKIVTLEGETLQVARFHEEMPGHRIGPVSCLEFHRHKLLLAAGATNSLVSIYKPKHPTTTA